MLWTHHKNISQVYLYFCHLIVYLLFIYFGVLLMRRSLMAGKALKLMNIQVKSLKSMPLCLRHQVGQSGVFGGLILAPRPYV